jgi:hypothetical protein
MKFQPVDEMSLRHLFSSELGEKALNLSYLGPKKQTKLNVVNSNLTRQVRATLNTMGNLILLLFGNFQKSQKQNSWKALKNKMAVRE